MNFDPRKAWRIPVTNTEGKLMGWLNFTPVDESVADEFDLSEWADDE